MKLQSITDRRLIPVETHKIWELPEGLVEAAIPYRPRGGENLELCRIADSQCYVWAMRNGAVLVPCSAVLIEQYPKDGDVLVAIMA